MNIYLQAASVLTFAVGLIHPMLGGVMVFSRLRKGSWVPPPGGNVLHQRHIRILWASWHVMTVLGWLVAAALWALAAKPASGLRSFLLQVIIGSTSVSSARVLFATKAGHPGWVGLLGVLYDLSGSVNCYLFHSSERPHKLVKRSK